MSLKIQLLRCFKSDHRLSMDVVANAIQQSLLARGHEVLNFAPSSRLERFSSNRLVMRYLRYSHYPNQVKKKANAGADIQHVIDHGYAHLLPALRSDRRVVSAHDLIPLLTWKGKIETLSLDGKPVSKSVPLRKPMLNLYSLKFIQHFDHIVTISQSTANDLSEHLGLARDNISIIPPALSPIFSPQAAADIQVFKQKYKLDSSVKWVMLSGRETYKNHPNAFAAIRQLSESTKIKIGIVRAGLGSSEFDALVDHYGMRDKARSVFLDYSELPLLYGAVDCLLFPSLYEGFGLPVAEALACGKPVVISDRGSLPEVAGELAAGIDPFDIDGLAGALQRALYDKDYQATIAEQGPSAMQRFGQKHSGQSLDGLYQRLMA